jgi:hypothetical protein
MSRVDGARAKNQMAIRGSNTAQPKDESGIDVTMGSP